MFKPNGLCFSPDYKKLHVPTRINSLQGSSQYRLGRRRGEAEEWPGVLLDADEAIARQQSTVNARGEKAPEKKAATDTTVAGMPDGIRCDTEGNVPSAADGSVQADGVYIFASSGERIGLILLPEICTFVSRSSPKPSFHDRASRSTASMSRRRSVTLLSACVSA
jgi:gluconolactonase